MGGRPLTGRPRLRGRAPAPLSLCPHRRAGAAPRLRKARVINGGDRLQPEFLTSRSLCAARPPPRQALGFTNSGPPQRALSRRVSRRGHTRASAPGQPEPPAPAPPFSRDFRAGAGTPSWGPPGAWVHSRGAPGSPEEVGGLYLLLDDPLYNCPVPQFPHLSSVPTAVPAHRAAMTGPRYRQETGEVWGHGGYGEARTALHHQASRHPTPSTSIYSEAEDHLQVGACWFPLTPSPCRAQGQASLRASVCHEEVPCPCTNQLQGPSPHRGRHGIKPLLPLRTKPRGKAAGADGALPRPGRDKQGAGEARGGGEVAAGGSAARPTCLLPGCALLSL